MAGAFTGRSAPSRAGGSCGDDNEDECTHLKRSSLLSFKASLSFVIVLDESNVTLSIPISSAQ